MGSATPRVVAEWTRRVAAEYRSAAIAASLVHRAIAAGFPEPLLHTGLRIVRDELDHASLSHGCLGVLAGEEAPVALEVGPLVSPKVESLLASLVDTVVQDFCLGETLAVPLFRAMHRGTRHPAVLPVLVRILADEAVHRQFGWDALDELLARDPTGVRAYVGERLGGWLDAVRDAYAPPGPSAPLDPDERACGLLERAEYREVFWQTVHADLAPRFRKRDLPFRAPDRGSD